MNTGSTLSKILFPTDFSASAKNALETALNICMRHKAELHILHVVENSFMIAPPDANIAAFYVLPEMEKTGKKNLDVLVRKIRKKHKVSVHPHIAFGNPADMIRDKAIELGCDMIVMGTHGASGLREFFIGSNAYSVIKTTTIPVLTIPAKKKFQSFKTILFPVRPVKGVLEKLKFIEPIIEMNEAVLLIEGLSLKGEEKSFDLLEKELASVSGELAKKELKYRKGLHVCRNFSKKVLELSRKHKADLIVITATLDFKWSQFFIGPFAQQVVNHSKVPVLSIRNMDVSEPHQPPVNPGRNKTILV